MEHLLSSYNVLGTWLSTVYYGIAVNGHAASMRNEQLLQ